jgi:hypothetical protein
MGDSPNDPLRVDFDCQIRLEFHGSTVTSDAGLLAYRELNDFLGLTNTATTGLHDTRTGQNTQDSLLAFFRQSIYSRLAGYENVNDAERLCLDPALRAVMVSRAKDAQAAASSKMARFETEALSTQENLKHLMDHSGQWIDQAHLRRQLAKLILDIHSSVNETYGHQEGSAYNGPLPVPPTTPCSCSTSACPVYVCVPCIRNAACGPGFANEGGSPLVRLGSWRNKRAGIL